MKGEKLEERKEFKDGQFRCGKKGGSEEDKDNGRYGIPLAEVCRLMSRLWRRAL